MHEFSSASAIATASSSIRSPGWSVGAVVVRTPEHDRATTEVVEIAVPEKRKPWSRTWMYDDGEGHDMHTATSLSATHHRHWP